MTGLIITAIIAHTIGHRGLTQARAHRPDLSAERFAHLVTTLTAVGALLATGTVVTLRTVIP